MPKEEFPQDDQTLKFDEATHLTIEEAVQKEADLAAGVTDQDSVLDKYIKKNRDKVGKRKFDSQPQHLTNREMLAALDSFIQEHRKDLTEPAVPSSLSVAEVEGQPVSSPPLGASSITSQPKVSEEKVVAPLPSLDFPRATADGPVAPTPLGAETFYGDTFINEKPVYKHKKAIVGGLAALLLTTVGLAYGMNLLNKSAGTTNTSASSSGRISNSTSSMSSSSSTFDSSKAQADSKAFDDLLKTFFADEAQTKPLNSAFENLPQLEEALKKLENTPAYETAKAKFDQLSKTVAAVQAVNAQFESPVIVDGELQTASLKPEANLDTLTATVLNTGKANLDSLIQGAITQARSGGQVTGPGSATAGQQESKEAAGTVAAPVAKASSPAAETPTAKETGPVASNLQRELSRVPYNDQAIADSQNPAWAFNPGILEEILRVSRERGYIVGDDYILDPVNIVNGNGYYNLYKADGTYLFSLNAKTGYFVGNAAGNADALDY